MVFSAGMPEHYSDAGYKALIIEWNNAKKNHPEWPNEMKYLPQLTSGAGDKIIPVIWADSIAFQKFQRYVHGENNLEEYLEYIKEVSEDGSFPVYCNDAEVFNYRPGRFKTEAEVKEDEWERIFCLYNSLSENGDYKFILPSEVLNDASKSGAMNLITPGTSAHPVLVKKQDKYNINRWALTGRDNLSINSDCYALYKDLKESGSKDENKWKNLCFLWSSDFRTHITDKRWKAYKKVLSSELKNISKSENAVQTSSFSPEFNYIKNDRYLKVEGKGIEVAFNLRKGMSISSLVFQEISPEPLLGEIPFGKYSDIALAADFFSGHSIVEKPAEHKASSLSQVNPVIIKCRNGLLKLKAESESGGIQFLSSYKISSNYIELTRELIFPYRSPAKIIQYAFTMIPENWDIASLYYETHNGGNCPERYLLGESISIPQSPLSLLVSSKQGMGATEGIIKIGDKNKSLVFSFRQDLSALIPSMIFQKSDCGKYFLRLNLSAGETDETFRQSPKKYSVQSVIKISSEKL